MKNNSAKYLPLILLLGLAIGAWLFGLTEYLSVEELQRHHVVIEQYIAKHYMLAILMYMMLYIFIVSISLPGASAMTLLGGFLFGQLTGTAIVVVSATIGASILFASVKLATSGLTQKRAANWAKKMQTGFAKDAFSYLLALRLVPLFPFFAINLAAAFLQVRFFTFFFATLIGIIPGTFIYITLGSGLRDFTETPELSGKLALGLVGLAVIALLPIMYKKFFKDKR